MKEYTALNPTVYSFESQKADVIYTKVLQTGIRIKKYVVGIRSFNHEVYIAKTHKIALAAY